MSDWIFRSVYTFSTRLDSRLDIDSTRCVQCTTHSHIHMNIEPRLWLYDYRLLFLTNGASDTRMVYICILRYMYVNGWILIHIYVRIQWGRHWYYCRSLPSSLLLLLLLLILPVSAAAAASTASPLLNSANAFNFAHCSVCIFHYVYFNM